MTMQTPAPTLVPVHGGGAGSRGRPVTSSRTADADFGKHLAGVASDRSSRPTAAAPEHALQSAAVWRRASDADKVLAGELDVNGDAEPVGDIAWDTGAQAAATLVPTAVLPVAAPLDNRQQTMEGATPATLTSLPADVEIESILMRARGAARAGAIPPTARVATAQATPDVYVVSRETHLPPAATPVPGASDAASPEDAMSLEGVDLVAADARPPPTGPAVRGKDGGQWPGNGWQGRSAAADAGAQQGQPAVEDALLEVGPVGRAAAGQDAQGAPPSLPLRQIADRIASELQSAGDAGRSNPPSAPAGTAPHTVLKVLTIQLHPVELGAVTVRIALKNDTLELQIEAGRHDTARLVEAERDQLSGLLRSAGYSVETMTVRAVEMPSAPAQAGSSLTQSDGGAAQAQSGGAQPDAKAPGGRPQAERHGNPNSTLRDSNDAPDSPRHRPGDGVYL